MSAPEFSVVIPTFNRPNQLAECLEGLSRQSLDKSRFEVIVVDDGGHAPAAPVAARFSSRLAIRCHRQNNAGPAAARNAGARLATGQRLAFTDDDCVPAHGWLEAFRIAALQFPGALLGGTTVNALTSNPYASASQLIQDFVYTYYNSDPAQSRFFASNNFALPASDFLALGGFRPEFRTSEDREFCARWRASSHQMVLLPSAIVHHAHTLTFSSFWRQHCGYGRGARRFQLASRAFAARSSIEPRFYFSTLLRLPSALHSHDMPLAMVALLGVWQAANFTGWALELLQSGRTHAPQ